MKAFNFLQQQERFDEFIAVYNNERPHQALDGAYPGDLYTPSARVYEPPAPPDYPFHDRAIRVTACGRICIGRRKINLSTAFAGQTVGIREVEDQVWLVSFLDPVNTLIGSEWRPLLNAYRTFCCAPDLETRIILEEIGRTCLRADPP